MTKFAPVLLFALLSASSLLAQAPKKTIAVKGNISIDFVADSAWLDRHAADMKPFARANDSLKADPTCDVLLLGSSSIRMWSNCQRDLAPLKVINRGYGGSYVRDMIYNYSTLIGPLRPRNVVIYIGNDISGSKESVLVGESYKRFCFFIEQLSRDLPQAHIYLMSVHICKSRIALKDETLRFNDLLKEYASLNSHVTYVDVASALTDDQKVPINKCFLPDNLHLTPEGYEQWTSVLRGHLLK